MNYVEPKGKNGENANNNIFTFVLLIKYHILQVYVWVMELDAKRAEK